MHFLGDKIKISKVWPGGNPTAVIEGIRPTSERKQINQLVLEKIPDIEQVVFYEKVRGMLRIEMAGGEFCGNAVRSVVSLLLKQPANVSCRISGTRRFIQAGKKEGDAIYTQIPFKKMGCKNGIPHVEMEGISFLLVEKKAAATEARKIAYDILQQAHMLTDICAGVIFYEQTSVITIDPYIWIRDLQTFTRETACASGTAALGLFLWKEGGQRSLEIRQPSGEIYKLSDLDTDTPIVEGKVNVSERVTIQHQEKEKVAT